MEEEVLGIGWFHKIEETAPQEQIRIPKLVLTNIQTASIELPTKSQIRIKLVQLLLQ